MSRWLERLGIAVASVALAIGVIVVLSGGLAGGRDDPGISTGAAVSGPGTAYPDQGDTLLKPGDLRPVYNSNPPTSGAHIPLTITQNGQTISDDQLLQALSLGNVVFMYGTPTPPTGLQKAADAVAPAFTPALARVGQAIILARRIGLTHITALAWAHMEQTDSGPALRAFANYYLGRGASAHARTVSGTG